MTESATPGAPTTPDTPAADVNLALENIPVIRITTEDGIQHLVTPIGRLAWPVGEFLAFLVTDEVEGAWGDIVRCRLAIPGTTDYPGIPGFVERIAGPGRGTFTLAEDIRPMPLRTLWRYVNDFIRTGAETDQEGAIKRVIRNCAPAGLIPWCELPEEVLCTSLGERSLYGVIGPIGREIADELKDNIVLIGADGEPTNPEYAVLLTQALRSYDILELSARTHADAIVEEIVHRAPIDHSY